MLFTSNQLFGNVGEELALAYLQAIGYHARLVSRYSDKLDIICEGVLGVHVKISRPLSQYTKPGHFRTYWHFNVSNVPDNVDSLIMLICQDSKKDYWYYLVPSWLIWQRMTVNITSHPLRYRGRLREFRDNRHIVAELIRRRMKQVHQLDMFDSDIIFDRTIKEGEQWPLLS